MPRQIALLRGINVGGGRKVPMAQLRAVFEASGHTDVVTYIQSGNVVFTAAKPVTAKTIETAIAKEFGFDVTVVVRTPAQLKKVLASNPFATHDTSTLHFGFYVSAPPAATIKKLDASSFAPDEFAVKGTELYLHLPNGLGRSKLVPYLDRHVKVPVTVRNWNTVTKLLELS